MTFVQFLDDRRAWSQATFGPDSRSEGVCKHIEKELAEIRAKPGDLFEWVDVVLLALDGASRAGFSAEEIYTAILAKHERNKKRKWPPPAPQDQFVEHVKDGTPEETL